MSFAVQPFPRARSTQCLEHGREYEHHSEAEAEHNRFADLGLSCPNPLKQK